MSTFFLESVDGKIIQKFTAKARRTPGKNIWNLRELGGFAVLSKI
jgi:hypothetical protein